MAYGYDGNMSAIQWLTLIGTDGVSTLREADRSYLQASGIITNDGIIVKEQLELAQKLNATESHPHAH